MKILSSKKAKILLGSLVLFSHSIFGTEVSAAELNDMCTTQGASTSLSDGVPICLSDNGTAWLWVGPATSGSSVAITTGHGEGDLSVFAKEGTWPDTNANSSDPKSISPNSNKECIVINNLQSTWLHIGVTGSRTGASLVADLGASSCRTINDGNGNNIPPTAAIDGPYTAEINTPISMSSNGSTDSDGSIVSWNWDFGDGNASNSANPIHTYTSAGSFTVTLTVTDNDGATGIASTISNITDSSNPPTNQYCEMKGGGTYEWIAGVKFGDLNNTSSGASAYTDFTSNVATVSTGNNTITLTPGFSGNSYTEYWSVWIDYNKDGDFLDSGEEVATGNGTSVVTATVNIPSTAAGTSTRMRVAMKYNGAPSGPCTDVTSGEVEDYTVSIGGSNPDPDPTPGTLPDMCATQEPSAASSLEDGVPVCAPAASQKHGFSVSTWNIDPTVTSIAFSTAHGLGNLTLATSADAWPKAGDNSIRSSHVGNTECVVLTQPKNGWNYVQMEGLFKGVSIVADFNTTSCRVTPGASDPGNDGYDFNGVHVLVYPFRFPDQDLEFTTAQINAEMQKTKDYFAVQSYGNFNFTWEIKPKITMPNNHSYYNNDKPKWNPAYKEQLVNAGVDPNFPGDGTIIMVTAPPIGTEATNYINSQAGPPLMEIYTYKAGTIAHETGHALGLHHSMAIEGGNSTCNGNSNDVVTNYGNVFGLMGMGAHTLEEINLMYKGYFQNPKWFSDTEVPTITASGTYRIYTYDQGTASGHGTPGAIGLKIKSGDGDKTYWVEYKTSQHSEDNTADNLKLRTPLLQNGVLINLQNYMDDNAAPWYNHNSLMLDHTPNSRSSNWALEDFNDAPLQIGSSFTDPWNGFRITPVAKGGELGSANAWIEVEITIL